MYLLEDSSARRCWTVEFWKGEYYVDFTNNVHSFNYWEERHTGPRYRYIKLKLVKKIEDLNEFWAVLKHKIVLCKA
jgi:hypothetical protein